MMRTSLVVAALMTTSCAGETGIVRERSMTAGATQTKANPASAAESSTGWDKAEDVPSTAQTGRQWSEDLSKSAAPVVVGHDISRTSRTKKKFNEPLAAQESSGFDNAEDVPSIAQTGRQTPQTEILNIPPPKTAGKMQVEVVSSSVPVVTKAESLPHDNEQGDDGEHPNVIDSIPYENPADVLDDLGESGSSLQMFFFVACGACALAWFYTQKRSQNDKASDRIMVQQLLDVVSRQWCRLVITASDAASKNDKADSAKNMFRPLVQEAIGALGSVGKTQCDDEDDLLADAEEDIDPTVGLEDSFFDKEDDLLANAQEKVEKVPEMMEFRACDESLLAFD